MHKEDILIKNISKIEGHTHLDVKIENKKVQSSKLKIAENKRFFTQAVLNLKFNAVPSTMSRICGTCSSAHTLCSIEAVEKALNFVPSEQTYLMRKLLINAGHFRDHAMHLYFFCLPDIFNKDSILQFSGKLHQWIHDGLDVKNAGNTLATLVGGRAVHPPNAVLGGFTAMPKLKDIENSIKQMAGVREKVIKLIDLFYDKDILFKRKTNYVGLVNDDFNYIKGQIKTSFGSLIKEEKYGNHLNRVVLPYSTATAFKFESKEYFVGALARLNLNKQSLNKNTIKDIKKYLDIYPIDCIFKNRLSQAIEILHEIDSCIEILEKLKNQKLEKIPQIKPKSGIGVGVVEAPRGTLYYYLKLNQEGKIIDANLCIPTQQNIIHMQNSISKYVQQMLDKKTNKKKISLEVEKMIRAYDPCMSCATHFLKINWI